MKAGIKLAFLIPNMGPGGAQRVMSLLANRAGRQAHQVLLNTLDDGTSCHYALEENVVLNPLNLSAASRGVRDAIRNNRRRLVQLRRALTETNPDLVLSFTDRTNTLACLALLGTPLPLVVSDRIYPVAEESPAPWRLARQAAYHRADAIVLQTQDVRQTLPKVLADRIHVIANPIRGDLPSLGFAKRSRFIAAGRLTRQKGFDLLLEAFAKAHDSLPQWSLEIYGDGPEQQSLTALGHRLGIQHSVHFKGVTRDLPKEFCEGGIFVLSSRYEGFPNVLLEAMGVGLPCIATSCRSGPADIVRHGFNGLLVETENTNEMSRAMLRLAKSPELQKKLAAEAKAVRETYDAARIFRRWENAFDDAIDRSLRRWH